MKRKNRLTQFLSYLSIMKVDIYNALVIFLSDHPEFEHPRDLYLIEPNFDHFLNELKK
jgi:hypothetical protein